MIKFRTVLAILLCMLCIFPHSPSPSRAQAAETLPRVSGELLGTDAYATALITGTRKQNSPYIRNIRIRIESKDGEVFSIKPPIDGGYAPEIQIADFKNAGYDQILYTANSGGSGGFDFSYVFDAATREILFDWERSANPFHAEFVDGRRVEISDGKNVFYANYHFRNPEEIAKIYDADGNVKTPTQAQVYPIGHVSAYYDESENRWILLTYREVSGLYHADKLGNLVERFVYEDGAFRTVSVGFMQPRAMNQSR